MYVGRLHLDGVDDDEHRELYHRGVVARRVLAGEIGVARRDVDFVGAPVEGVHRLLDFRTRGDDGLDVAPVQNVPQRIDGVVAHRVGERDRYRIAVRQNRHDAVLPGDFGRHLLRYFRIDGIRVDVAVLEAELVRDRAEDVVFADRAA